VRLWERVLAEATRLRAGESGASLAVRSSAAGEDSSAVSFAGEFETVLNVRGDDELRQAIHKVYRSRESERAAAYSAAIADAHGLGGAIQTTAAVTGDGSSPRPMGIIVQRMVPATLAGVLFTAHPVSGSQLHMSGSFVQGLGEGLVSGETDGQPFTLTRPKGSYDGPAELRPFASKLYKLGERLARDLGGPQDIEWAIANGHLAVLQSRPITTMQPYNPYTGEWNDSRRGDYLWSNANFGEALPEVMTPLTWSLVQIYAEETFGNPLPGNDPLMGNIGGRFYVNLSLFASMMQSLGFSRERMNRESEEFFGNLPDDVEIPTIPFSRSAVLRRFAPFALRAVVRRARNLRRLAAFTEAMPERVAALRQAIEAAESAEALAQLWETDFEPLLRRAYQMLQAGTSKYENAYRPLHRELGEQVGEDEANLLLSGVSAVGDPLASIGPLLGLWKVAQREWSRDDFLDRYGHRGPNEFEVSWPRPAEDPAWLDQQLASLDGVDVPAMLARREAKKQAAWERFERRFPRQANETKRKVTAAASAARGREAIRSEITRLFALERLFALRVGEMSGLGEGVFFLWLEELLAVLRGDEAAREWAMAQIPIRLGAHERLSALPPYPALISGRFDPYVWEADPERRSDVFGSHSRLGFSKNGPASAIVRGLPASAGVVEGPVRRLLSLKDSAQLRPGEILVATTTNVGWTPLFPRAAAVVTDVGAPLSHAAIVARELGIPAVVGAGDATMRLRTGDRVRVDGAQGTVEKLEVGD
jgi:phosphohistidine swiveling domain-containing protein